MYLFTFQTPVVRANPKSTNSVSFSSRVTFLETPPEEEQQKQACSWMPVPDARDNCHHIEKENHVDRAPRKRSMWENISLVSSESHEQSRDDAQVPDVASEECFSYGSALALFESNSKASRKRAQNYFVEDFQETPLDNYKKPKTRDAEKKKQRDPKTETKKAVPTHNFLQMFAQQPDIQRKGMNSNISTLRCVYMYIYMHVHVQLCN